MDFRPNQLSFHFRSDYAIDGLPSGFGNSFSLSLSLFPSFCIMQNHRQAKKYAMNFVVCKLLFVFVLCHLHLPFNCELCL